MTAPCYNLVGRTSCCVRVLSCPCVQSRTPLCWVRPCHTTAMWCNLVDRISCCGRPSSCLFVQSRTPPFRAVLAVGRALDAGLLVASLIEDIHYAVLCSEQNSATMVLSLPYLGVVVQPCWPHRLLTTFTIPSFLYSAQNSAILVPFPCHIRPLGANLTGTHFSLYINHAVLSMMRAELCRFDTLRTLALWCSRRSHNSWRRRPPCRPLVFRAEFRQFRAVLAI